MNCINKIIRDSIHTGMRVALRMLLYIYSKLEKKTVVDSCFDLSPTMTNISFLFFFFLSLRQFDLNLIQFIDKQYSSLLLNVCVAATSIQVTTTNPFVRISGNQIFKITSRFNINQVLTLH